MLRVADGTRLLVAARNDDRLQIIRVRTVLRSLRTER
jgi:hypothetical protein